MFSNLFGGIFDSSTVTVIPVYQFLLCVVVSLLLGIVLAAAYTYKSKYNAGFVRTLAILPAVVCIVIMMVNGNVGTGVAVAGAFSLVRFRSVPGSAKEIGAIFIAMGAGLVSGMGYLGYAVLYTVILSLVMALYVQIRAWEKNAGSEKTMVITIPEDLDYTEVFDDLLEDRSKDHQYGKSFQTDLSVKPERYFKGKRNDRPFAVQKWESGNHGEKSGNHNYKPVKIYLKEAGRL